MTSLLTEGRHTSFKRDVAGDFLPVKAKVVLFHSAVKNGFKCALVVAIFSLSSFEKQKQEFVVVSTM